MTRAEALALAVLSALITSIVLAYVSDALGLGIWPRLTTLASLVSVIAIAFVTRHARSGSADVAVFVVVVVGTLALTLWLAWPALLPPGSGPDLTHHLLLVDYIERHGTLVHDPNAAALIGEMAQYTPGAHVLAVVGGRISGSSGFIALYPVVAFSVALKFGMFTLCLLRLFGDHRARVALAVAGVSLVFYFSGYTLDTFIRDSFLAQVVAELFAVSMWWALILWNRQPSAWMAAIFGACGAAAFLTWPMWCGPPIAAFAILLTTRRDLRANQRIRHFLHAAAPIAIVAAVHTLGRSRAFGLVATSGAISLPPLATIDWCLLGLAIVGLGLSAAQSRYRVVAIFVGAMVLQAVALWLIARRSGAATPYMALKMAYLVVYPAIAAAMIAIERAVSKPLVAPLLSAALVIVAARHVAHLEKPTPVVSRDLYAAGLWARDHVPPACVDYLVANDYTAYWLHLAVLRNPRATTRSADDNTYATQPSFARWLTDDDGAPYAIARLSVLPAEIRERVRTMHRVGDAAVLARSVPCRE